MTKKTKPSIPKVKSTAVTPSAAVDEVSLLSDLRGLIQTARQRIATTVYSTQTLLCWHVGRRLLSENLQGGRAAYGKQILVTVSRELTAEYERGFSYAEIARMIQVRFTRHFYKPQPLCTPEEISADMPALEKQTEGLFGEIIARSKA